ncbi:MAG: glycoside hydrolase [Lentisphaeria bacterium]|nr:glycoside hydrolase [Lentisphaeria bacterium]
MRTSTDNGRTWTPARPISSGSEYTLRNQPIAGTLMTKNGTLIQPCDATWDMEGPTAIHISRDDGKNWPVRKLLTPGEDEFDGGAWTKEFSTTTTRSEHAGYLSATQTPNGMIHLISSRLHYRFNLPWLLEGVSTDD